MKPLRSCSHDSRAVTSLLLAAIIFATPMAFVALRHITISEFQITSTNTLVFRAVVPGAAIALLCLSWAAVVSKNSLFRMFSLTGIGVIFATLVLVVRFRLFIL